jgi:hypothetical protein
MWVFAGNGRCQESDSYYNRGLKLAGRDLQRFSQFREIVRVEVVRHGCSECSQAAWYQANARDVNDRSM